MNSQNNLIALFKELDLNDKRNEYNNLTMKMNDIINAMLNDLGSDTFSNIKNYDQNKDCELTEDEILTFFYEDLWILKNKLLMLYSFNKSKE